MITFNDDERQDKQGLENLFFLPDHDDWDSTLLAVNHYSPKDWFKSYT